jgi:t-SNARE complex subunit (syntaxin)
MGGTFAPIIREFLGSEKFKKTERAERARLQVLRIKPRV